LRELELTIEGLEILYLVVKSVVILDTAGPIEDHLTLDTSHLTCVLQIFLQSLDGLKIFFAVILDLWTLFKLVVTSLIIQLLSDVFPVNLSHFYGSIETFSNNFVVIL
jgi:hypothetical protein